MAAVQHPGHSEELPTSVNDWIILILFSITGRVSVICGFVVANRSSCRCLYMSVMLLILLQYLKVTSYLLSPSSAVISPTFLTAPFLNLPPAVTPCSPTVRFRRSSMTSATIWLKRHYGNSLSRSAHATFPRPIRDEPRRQGANGLRRNV